MEKYEPSNKVKQLVIESGSNDEQRSLRATAELATGIEAVLRNP